MPLTLGNLYAPNEIKIIFIQFLQDFFSQHPDILWVNNAKDSIFFQ